MIASETIRHGVSTVDVNNTTKTRVVLSPNEPTAELKFRISGTIEKSGSDNNDAAVRDEAIQRLFDIEVHTISPNRAITHGAISLRELFLYSALNASSLHKITQPDASDLNAAGTQTTDFEILFSIRAFRNYLMNAAEVYWPSWDGVQGPKVDKFVIDIFHNRTRLNSDSDRGTDAIFSAGTDDYAFSAGPDVEVWQEVAPGLQGPREDGNPLYLPTYHSVRSDTFTSENKDEDHVVEHGERMDLVMFRYEEGSDRDADPLSDGIFRNLTIEGKRAQVFDKISADRLTEDARQLFLAYDGSDSGENFEGYYPIRLASGGRLRSAIDPTEHTNFRYVFDHDDPNSDPGSFQIFSALLETP